MTQKELSYLEDAIGHEKTIISIINDMKNNLQDQNLVTFIENELNSHETLKENLMNKLEEKSNE